MTHHTPFRAAPVLAAVLAMLLSACSKPEAPPPEPQPTVEKSVIHFPGDKPPATLRMVEVAASGDHAVRLTGRLAWDEDRTARVYAPYAGRVERLLVQVGQQVQRGQALAQISSADIGQAQADLHKAQADQALAQSATRRARELVEAGVIARKDLEQAEADLARGAAEAGRARARLSQYGVASGAINQSLTLSAPVAGLVVERNGNLGAEVRTDVQGGAMFTISDPSTLWAAIDVDERQLALLRPGQTVALSAAAWPGETFEATVLTVGASVDPASRTVKVRARVRNPDGKLKAEMFVNAELRVKDALPLVPSDAVFLDGEKSYAFVQQGPGRYERRTVKVTAAGPQSFEVLEGLKAGDQVVVGGSLYLNALVDNAK